MYFLVILCFVPVILNRPGSLWDAHIRSLKKSTTREGGREGDARGKRYGNICICITDSLCYKAETNTPL